MDEAFGDESSRAGSSRNGFDNYLHCNTRWGADPKGACIDPLGAGPVDGRPRTAKTRLECSPADAARLMQSGLIRGTASSAGAARTYEDKAWSRGGVTGRRREAGKARSESGAWGWRDT
jgi:hypothetical protein